MPNTLGWARPWAIARPFSNPTPRAGAWYPIAIFHDPEMLRCGTCSHRGQVAYWETG